MKQVEIKEHFLRALRADDDLGLVVRAHIHIEHELDGFIRAKLPNYEELGSRMEYSARVRLALACGLPSRLKGPLNAIGKLRNDFSHQLGMYLSHDRADKIYNTFDKLERDAAEHAYGAIVKKLPDRSDHTLANREARDRLVIYMVTVWAAIVVEAEQGD